MSNVNETVWRHLYLATYELLIFVLRNEEFSICQKENIFTIKCKYWSYQKKLPTLFLSFSRRWKELKQKVGQKNIAPTHTHTHTHTQMHTHTHSLSHTHIHTHSLSFSLFLSFSFLFFRSQNELKWARLVSPRIFLQLNNAIFGRISSYQTNLNEPINENVT